MAGGENQPSGRDQLVVNEAARAVAGILLSAVLGAGVGALIVMAVVDGHVCPDLSTAECLVAGKYAALLGGSVGALFSLQASRAMYAARKAS